MIAEIRILEVLVVLLDLGARRGLDLRLRLRATGGSGFRAWLRLILERGHADGSAMLYMLDPRLNRHLADVDACLRAAEASGLIQPCGWSHDHSAAVFRSLGEQSAQQRAKKYGAQHVYPHERGWVACDRARLAALVGGAP